MLRWFRRGEWLAARVSPQVAYVAAHLVGATLVWVPGVRRVLLDHQRRLLPHATRATWRRNARRVLTHVAMNYYDLFRLPCRSPDDVRRYYAFSGLEHYEAACARGKGVIFTGAHLGNFNYVAAFAPHVATPAVAVVEQLGDPELHTYFSRLRGHPDLEIIANGPTGARTLLRTLRQNGIVMMLGDRDAGGVTDEVEFFGAPARLPAGLGLIARRTGAAILPGTAYRTGAASGVLFLGPPVVLPEIEGTPEARRAADTQAVARVVERVVAVAPDQWVVLQPVWKPHDPLDEPPALA